MDKIYKKGEILLCPHCEKEPDFPAEPVEDYVIPHSFGVASISPTQCGWCDEWFEVEALKDGTFRVSESEDEESME